MTPQVIPSDMVELPAHVPRQHAAFLHRAVPRLASDARVIGVAAAGSLAGGQMDEFSDLDLVIGIEPDAVSSMMTARQAVAADLGPLAAAFTGEHVGEPRLLICLYEGEPEPAPLHVDLKFVSLEDLGPRVDEPVVLWARDARFAVALLAGEGRYPPPDPQWIEDRFWVWLHYGAARLGRGELFETLDMLGFLRSRVFGPLSLIEAGATPSGVRRLETQAPERAAAVAATVAAYDGASCLRALMAAADLYRSLRDGISPPVLPNRDAERVALDYVHAVARALGVPVGRR